MLLRHTFRKLAGFVLVLGGVVLLVFLLFQGLGDPARMVAGQTGNAQTLENIRKELYLDQPSWKQFLFYVNDLSPVCVHQSETIRKKRLQGFFMGGTYKLGIKIPYLRNSYQSKKPVAQLLVEALPGTILLAFSALLLATVLGMLLGTLAALRKGTWLDGGALFLSVIGISGPSFLLAILIAYFFGIYLHNWTGLSFTGSWMEVDEVTGERVLGLRNLILPALTLGIRPMAIIAQLTRSSLLDALSQDYVRTAFAKGLAKRTVIFRHALPNALNPVITSVTGWLAELLAGSFFVEYIFGWRGIGKVTVDALEKLDYPVVMGAVLLSALIFIFINMLTDRLYGILDPRVRDGAI